MKRSLPLCVAILLLTACPDREAGEGQPPDAAASPSGPAAAPVATAAGRADNDPASGGARKVEEETEDFVFDYSYPADAGAIPELAALLDGRLERARTLLARQAAEGREAARDNGFPYNKYSWGMEWRVVAALSDWLSLSGELSSYTGGAHGNYGVQSLVWNKQAGEAMRGVDLFTSPQALGDALGDRYCDALDALRAERRSEPIEGEDYGFNDCPPVGDLTVLVGSSNNRTFNRLTLYAGPYVAGPYAEGAYEVHLDVDEAVLGAVKPEYRQSFSTRR